MPLWQPPLPGMLTTFGCHIAATFAELLCLVALAGLAAAAPQNVTLCWGELWALTAGDIALCLPLCYSLTQPHPALVQARALTASWAPGQAADPTDLTCQPRC